MKAVDAHYGRPGPGTAVLDVGGGIGGPARTLAHELGCRVTVLDITEEFCRAGADLTRRAGLANRVTFQHGSALEMPFPDASFETVWTQHSSMNIEDKERLYRESARVLHRGGRLAIHEIMAGPNAPPHFPVPWARDPSISFLRPPAAVRALVGGLGIKELAWIDESAVSLAWLRQRLADAAASAPPTLGLHLLLGPDAAPMFKTMTRNLEEARIAVVKGLWERA